MLRFTIGDAAELAGDVGPDPRLIAVLAELDGAVDPAELRALVVERATGFPPLTHRVVRPDAKSRSPHWEQVVLRPAEHVFELATQDPVATVIEILTAGLPETIPMWRLAILRSPDAAHLLFVAHHVLLDGATAVAAVGALFGIRQPDFPSVDRPTRTWLAPVSALATLTTGSSATSLLTPLTSGFRLAAIEVDLEPLRDAARRAGATINDLLLTAVAEALRAAASRRGERLRRLVVSVPTTGPAGGEPGRNRVGALLVSVPARRRGETDTHLLGRIAARTRRRKWLARVPSGSTAVSATLVALGRMGWYRPLFERQRAITTLVTNVHGPSAPLAVLNTPVRSLTPISPALGNVTVVVAALSYAGRFRIVLRLDRSVWDLEKTLVEALTAALTRLAGPGSGQARPTTVGVPD